MSSTSNTEVFIEKAKRIHGDTYDYSKTEYINSSTKITITCSEHGDFQVTPNNHLSNGSGCNRCCSRKRRLPEDFIREAQTIHGDKYDYSLIEVVNSSTKLPIICREHGVFYQKCLKHLYGNGCPKCSNKKRADSLKKGLSEFIDKSSEKHLGKYDYSLVEYDTLRNKVPIICPKHGVFYQRAQHHMNGVGCPKCANRISNAENELFDYVKKRFPDTIKNVVGKIGGKYELDIFIPELNIAIEYNGVVWHSVKYKNPSYHHDKYLLCLQNGIRLIQIWEDEWLADKESVLSKLEQVLNGVYEPEIKDGFVELSWGFSGVDNVFAPPTVRYVNNYGYDVYNAGYVKVC